MSLPIEVAIEVTQIRKDLLALMFDARTTDDSLKAARDDLARMDRGLQAAEQAQASLKSAILASLDALDRIDERLRKR